MCGLRAGSVLLLASMAGGCSLSADTSLAEKQVTQFHALLDQGRIAEMYAQVSPEMRAGTPEPDFVTFLGAVHRKLGTVQKTQMVRWRVDSAPPGMLVTLTYWTRYAGGEATEEFDYRIKSGAALLVRYDIKSNALVTK
jgi:uncharacterized protein DUF4019